MRLLVVGAGEMGRWLGSVLGPETEDLAFADADPLTAEDAAGEFADARAVPRDADESFDCVALAVPMPVVAEAIREHAPQAAEGTLVDVSGVMADPLAAMDEHATGEYASFHPLFAPPRAPGRIAFVPGEVGPVTRRVRAAFEEAGNEVFETTAGEHDAAMETVQAGTHAAVLSYALAAGDVRREFHTPISEPLSELARTITEGDPRVYADIQHAFEGADEVAKAARRLADADAERFRKLFLDARDRVGSTPRDDR